MCERTLYARTHTHTQLKSNNKSITLLIANEVQSNFWNLFLFHFVSLSCFTWHMNGQQRKFIAHMSIDTFPNAHHTHQQLIAMDLFATFRIASKHYTQNYFQ